MGEPPVYRRVVVKLSGEYLAGSRSFGIDQPTIDRIAGDLIAAGELGVEIAVVVGGGNIFRGVEVSSRGVSRPTGDTMGMLATVMNCIALESALSRRGQVVAHHVGLRHAAGLRDFSPGSGRPSPSRQGPGRAARRRHRQSVLHHRHRRGAARGRNRAARRVLKATQVDGVYSADPKNDKTAKRFERLSHREALAGGYKVMDAAAFALARENRCLSSFFRSPSRVRSARS